LLHPSVSIIEIWLPEPACQEKTEEASMLRVRVLGDIRTGLQALCFGLLLCGFGAASAVAQTDIWLGGAGNWNNGGMWSAGVPTNTSNVFIDSGNSKASPVTMDIQGQANNLTIDSDDSLSFNNGTSLAINGNSVSNAGNISLNSLGSLTELFIANGATLSGAGTVTMSNNSQNEVDGNSGATLTNKSTIQGVGNIGPHFMLANQGTINANVNGATLAVIQETAGTDTNTATLEATNGGILQIQTGGSSSLVNTGGTIKAIGTGSQVQLANGTTVSGGTFSTSSGGMIVQVAGGGSFLNGVTNAGSFSVLNNGTVNLSGTITNTGTFQLNSTGSLTELFVPSAATLTGAGTVTMSNNSQNEVDGNSGATLTNKSTIQGVGNIGPHFMLANQGTINANVNGATLAVIQETVGTDTNTATLEATNGGILQIQTGGSSSLVNTGGTIEAIGTGSQVQLANGTTVSGGTFSTSSGGMIVQVAGGGSFLNGVTNAGSFSILNNGTVNLLGSITNDGTIGVNSAGSLTELFIPTSSVTLFGKGRVVLNNSPNSAIDGNGGLVFTNQSTIQGGGMIGPHFTFTNNGTLRVPAANTLNINAPFTNFSVSTLTGGTYVVAGTLQFTNASITTNAAKITLSGSKAQVVNQSSVNALTNLATNTSKGAFTVTASQQFTTTLSNSFGNAGKVTVGKNSGFKVMCNPTFTCVYAQTAGMTTVDGVLTAAQGVNIQGGKLFGTGTVAGSVVSKASVTAGDSLAKAGKLLLTAYTQQATGSLNIQIGGTAVGTQYSQLAVGNGVSLNGTLNIKLINGFVPAVGNAFTILTGSAITGKFSAVNGMIFNNNSECFQVNYGANSVTLTAESGTRCTNG
jgi:hypothetical protein